MAETESISEAAERLVVSQPAVSATVTALQAALGTQLVRRDGRRIRLTAAGARLATYGRQVFALLEDAVEDVRALGDAPSRVRVGAVTTMAEHLLPPILGDIRRAHPTIEIDLDVRDRRRVWERLAAWEVHVVVAGQPPLDQRFRSIATRPNEIVVVAPANSSVAVENLAAQTWLLRAAGSGTRALTNEFFENLGIEPVNQLTIDTNGAIRECARAGLGVSLVSRDVVRREIESGELVEIETPITPMHRKWHVVVNDDHAMPPAAAQFVGALLDRWQQTL